MPAKDRPAPPPVEPADEIPRVDEITARTLAITHALGVREGYKRGLDEGFLWLYIFVGSMIVFVVIRRSLQNESK